MLWSVRKKEKNGVSKSRWFKNYVLNGGKQKSHFKDWGFEDLFSPCSLVYCAHVGRQREIICRGREVKDVNK